MKELRVVDIRELEDKRIILIKNEKWNGGGRDGRVVKEIRVKSWDEWDR